MNYSLLKKRGFTLVELLIVIALIAILSVAVLATINPIEQSNKAKDSTVQNDAAEVMNSYERYYANAQKYPWMMYGAVDAKPSVEDAMLLRSDELGFGICEAGAYTSLATVTASECLTTSASPGELIKSDELKTAFVGKDEFRTVAGNDENGLWLYKQAGSGGGIYVCYVPKAKSNRNTATNQLYCLTGGVTPGRTAVGSGSCTAPSTTDTKWADPTTAIADGDAAEAGIFKCVP
ncbi:MAG: type II secretion system protein [Candidatus Shapirobacteria bacterium]|nr:type II secretion system protein [Candidatus Shapirobacteria bacterium]